MSDAEGEFQRLVSGLEYPMYIVTAGVGDERAGCLVGFATQCSVAPPRYWICVSKKNHTYRVASRASALAVHVPSSDDLALARLFGEQTGDEADKFARCSWEPGPDGATPVLTGCPRWFLGEVLERVDSGDHVSFLLAPVAASGGDGRDEVAQLGFQAAKALDPGHET